MDVSGSSPALVIAAPTTRASAATRRTARTSSAAKRTARSSTAATPGLSTRCTRVVRSRNDQKMITWMRQCIINLEKLVKTKQTKIDELNARPAPSSERELYLLSEIELIGRQFESEYPESESFLKVHPQSSLNLIFSLLAVVNPDWQAENRRVEQRVAQEERGTPRVRNISGQTHPRPRS